MLRPVMMVLALAMAAGCAARQPAGPPPFDPVGTYGVTTQAGGNAVAGTLTIRRVDDGLRATLSTGVIGDIAIDRVVVEGKRIDMRTQLEMGELVMSIEFSDNDNYTGTWSIGGRIGGDVSGARRPPGGG